VNQGNHAEAWCSSSAIVRLSAQASVKNVHGLVLVEYSAQESDHFLLRAFVAAIIAPATLVPSTMLW